TTLGKLFTDVEATRERGYAIDEEEQELGVRCIAVPVPGAPTPMAISVSGPVTRVDEAFIDSAVPVLQEAARELGRQLVAAAD
ncbi:MAG: IclR family transcriptional regulator C-terminal domain-containing protein, partial [Glutamicibacter sp.]